MTTKKLFSVLTVFAVVALLCSIVSVATSAADLPISIGTPENVAVTQQGTALTVSYAVGDSDKSLLKMANNSLLLSLAGVETLSIGAQVDYKVAGMTDWLAEEALLDAPCNLTDSLAVTVNNPMLALVNWETTTLMVRVRWAGTVKMKGADATFMAGDWSPIATFGKPLETEPTATATEAAPTATATETEPTATATETAPTATATKTEPTATEAILSLPGDANNDGAVDMKDVLVTRKYLAGITTTIYLQNADVNRDNAVDMKDVLILRKYLAGMLAF